MAAHLGMRHEDLQALVVEHYDALVAAGLRPHRATVSEVDASLRVPGALNEAEPTLISKLSRDDRRV
ncbi:MAG: hypothetical protein AVDCRST_MAG93-6561 [uncultured Chloroflexia bacterium]|uniref:Uncharacterized protein n=1 Tax=uncultured Chloroflexia bacterium TaxID=1672391 RepID=A0A6J4LS22_9CHLR|nr:MAG: hypothetical protein AVDCRST_MAG93-6561 [uncultured Chloroflexia bacterium]